MHTESDRGIIGLSGFGLSGCRVRSGRYASGSDWDLLFSGFGPDLQKYHFQTSFFEKYSFFTATVFLYSAISFRSGILIKVRFHHEHKQYKQFHFLQKAYL